MSVVKPLNVVAFIGSARDGRIANRVVEVLKTYFKGRPEKHTLQIVDPVEYDLPVLRQPLHFYPDQSKAPKILHDLNDIVKKADCYIVITAEYNRCLPPALTNLMDHIPPASYSYKNSQIISYSMGPQGGVVAGMQARSFLTELGCPPGSHVVAISAAHKEIKEDGTTENTHIISSLGKLYNQLDWWGQCTRNGRENQGLPK